MSRKKKTKKKKTNTQEPELSTFVYVYGLPFGPDPESEEAVNDQLYLAHQYRNRLVALERDRRNAFRETMAAASSEYAQARDDIASLDQKLTKARAAISKANSQERTRTGTDKDRKTANLFKTKLKKARKHLKKVTKEALKADPALQAQVKLIDKRADTLHKLFRHECGLYWATYNLVEDAWKRSKKDSFTDPKFVSWDGQGEHGRVGVQIQKGRDKQPGMSVEELFSGKNTTLQIIPPDPRAWDENMPRGERCRLGRTRLKWRIKSKGPRKKPVWTEWSMIMHRPLPENCRIKSAFIKRFKIGPNRKWRLYIVVNVPKVEVQHENPGTLCGIDVGWRRLKEGLRVAYMCDHNDNHEQLLFDNDRVKDFGLMKQLASTRKKNFNVFRALLVQWINNAANGTSVTLPMGFMKELRHLERWRSQNRMRKFVWKWSRNRFSGDEDIFKEANAWRKQDRHLYEWEEGHRSRILKRRREDYRLWAKDLCQRYETIVVEKLDLSKLKKRANPEDEAEMPAEARRYRDIAALGELFGALDMMAPKHGCTILRVPPEYTTITCGAELPNGDLCMQRCDWDAAAKLRHTCESCGAEWDQDHNAARNLLAHGRGEFSAAAE